MKPGPSFKMTKANKFRLASILDPHKRGDIKRSLIQAQLAAETKIKNDRSSKGQRNTDAE